MMKTAIQAMVVFTIILLQLVLIPAKPAGSNDCPENQEVSCESLRSSEGFFKYTLPLSIPCPDCEQGWYYQNGTFIVDPSDGGSSLAVVAHVTSTTLTLTSCENLQWQLRCGKCAMKRCTINYTNPAPNKKGKDVDHDDNGKAEFPAWGIVLIVIGVGVGGAITAAHCYRNKIKVWCSGYFLPSSQELQVDSEGLSL